jgi:hypothetical protein
MIIIKIYYRRDNNEVLYMKIAKPQKYNIGICHIYISIKIK